jgi:hypothetical protein
LPYSVVHSKVEAVARTVVLVGAHILATDISDVFAIRQRSEGLAGLQIVNTAVGPVPASSHQKAEFLTRTPAAPEGAVEPAPPVAVLQRIVARRAVQRVGWSLLCGWRHNVHRAANPIRILIGRQRLVDLDTLNPIGRDCIHLHVAYRYFDGRNIHPINRKVVQARFRSANLHVLALALIAFQGDAGQAAHRVGSLAEDAMHGFARLSDTKATSYLPQMCAENLQRRESFDFRGFISHCSLCKPVMLGEFIPFGDAVER